MSTALTQRLAALPATDRRLLLAVTWAALATLALGVVAGLVSALARAGWLAMEPGTAFRVLTVHGVGIFFYWLYLAQSVLLLAFAATQGERGLAARGAAWVGFALIVAGFATSMVGAHMGTPLLYDGAPALADGPASLLVFDAGYLLLGLGLMVLPGSAIATLLETQANGTARALSAVGYALFTWSGFLMVSGFAVLHAFGPSAAWALGMGPFPATQGTDWHILFHNMHYLPLMATVIVWYVLADALLGVKSVFGERFSKIVFTAYLVFVPPTSLYHMFLEPDLPGPVRTAGSLLSLFVSVPTLTALLIVVGSIEVHARAHGGRGLFGWLRMLPWRHPGMAATGAAVINMALGLVFAFVLIQSEFAPLLSDTFFVPGYFHFFTVGTVTLSFLGALTVTATGLTGKPAWRAGLMSWMPWLATAGLLVFGAAGIAAGFHGVPRRVFDIGYGGTAPLAWQGLVAGIGIGGALMSLAVLVLSGGVAMTMLRRRTGEARAGVPTTDWSDGARTAASPAWVGPLAVLLIVAGMYLFTAIAFELMQALPVSATGGDAH